MSRLYDVHLKVPAELLTPLVQLVEGEGIIVKLGENGVQPMRGARRHTRYRDPEQRAEEAVVNILRQYDAGRLGMSLDHIARQLHGRGYSLKTAGKAVARARAEGWVVQLGNGTYCLGDEDSLARAPLSPAA